MSHTTRLLPMIDDALRALESEAAKAESGGNALDSYKTLTLMRDRLLDMKRHLSDETVEDERYRGSMTHIITDTWPRNNDLGRAIAEIEYVYYR